MAFIKDYRARCYAAYNSTQWQYTHSSTDVREYQFLAKIFKKRYAGILPENKNSKIIDIACGGGHFLYYLQQEGYQQAKGTDYSAEMLAVSRNMGIKNLEQADLFEYLPKHKGEFDVIIANDVIEHLKKDEVLLFLDLIREALKPGGMTLISTLNAQSFFGARTVHIDFTHEIGFTPVSLAQVMRVCGFRGINIFGEKLVIHDLRSWIRAALWRLVKFFLKAYIVIESGTGRGFKNYKYIFEPRIFTTGINPET